MTMLIENDQLKVTAIMDGTKYTTTCIPKPPQNLTITLRKEGGGTTLAKGEEFKICADFSNQSDVDITSVKAKFILPDCIEYTGNYSGIQQGTASNGGYFGDLWYNPQTRELSNLCHPDQISWEPMLEFLGNRCAR